MTAPRIYITQSRSGHYSVTLKDRGHTLMKEAKLSSLHHARIIANEYRAYALHQEKRR